MNLKILFEDTEVIVCYKPSGIPTQTGRVGTPDMVSLLKNYLYQNQKEKREPYAAVVHRLDQPVEGLLVFAKTPYAAKELSRQMQKDGFGKYYQAVLCGAPEKENGRVEDYLVKDGRTNTSRVCAASEKGAKKAVLFYEVVKRACVLEQGEHGMALSEAGEERTLVKIKLDTGRHHQIRVQMANLGCPIWGDAKYDKTETDGRAWRQIALCAYRLEFLHPKTKKQMQFEIKPEGEGFRIFSL